MGFTPDYKPEYGFETKPERITDYLILQREIQKAVTGKSFKVYIEDEEGKQNKAPEVLPGIPYEIFVHYYKLWQNYSFFGYPQGMNWLEMPDWFNDLLIMFQNASVKIQNLIDEYQIKNTQK